ncbi:MAG: hypothetical protein OXI94_03490 [Gemmatimonadota bacterium]|nr:hypothetical protein [Gemmatimonadota bacterium]
MEFVTIVGVIGAAVSAYFAYKSHKNARKANEAAQVVELHVAWAGVRNINPQKPIGPDVVKAINTLELTASFWNRDLVDKDIILDSCWTAFRSLYENLNDCTKKVPGLDRTGRELLQESQTIEAAYESMKTASLQ